MTKIFLLLCLYSFADEERGMLPQGQEWRECVPGMPVVQCATTECDDICSKLIAEKKAQDDQDKEERILDEEQELKNTDQSE